MSFTNSSSASFGGATPAANGALPRAPNPSKPPSAAQFQDWQGRLRFAENSDLMNLDAGWLKPVEVTPDTPPDLAATIEQTANARFDALRRRRKLLRNNEAARRSRRLRQERLQDAEARVDDYQARLDSITRERDAALTECRSIWAVLGECGVVNDTNRNVLMNLVHERCVNIAQGQAHGQVQQIQQVPSLQPIAQTQGGGQQASLMQPAMLPEQQMQKAPALQSIAQISGNQQVSLIQPAVLPKQQIQEVPALQPVAQAPGGQQNAWVQPAGLPQQQIQEAPHMRPATQAPLEDLQAALAQPAPLLQQHLQGPQPYPAEQAQPQAPAEQIHIEVQLQAQPQQAYQQSQPEATQSAPQEEPEDWDQFLIDLDRAIAADDANIQDAGHGGFDWGNFNGDANGDDLFDDDHFGDALFGDGPTPDTGRTFENGTTPRSGDGGALSGGSGSAFTSNAGTGTGSFAGTPLPENP